MPNNVTNHIVFSWDPNDGGTGNEIREIMEEYVGPARNLKIEDILPDPEDFLKEELVPGTAAAFLEAYHVSPRTTYFCNEPAAEHPRDDEIWCYTSWSPIPLLALRKLSRMYPTVQILHEYADEDVGYGCGYSRFKGGLLLDCYTYEDGSNAAFEFYAVLTGRDLKEDCGFVLNPETGEYEYDEGDEEDV